MTTNPYVVSPATSLMDAYNLMFEQEVRHLPVVQGQTLVGIITLSDIQRSIQFLIGEIDIATKLAITADTVRDVMTPDPTTVAPDDTIQEAAELMLENQVSGLPVVENNRVVGILTESDIFKLVVNWWAEAESNGNTLSSSRAVSGTYMSKAVTASDSQES